MLNKQSAFIKITLCIFLIISFPRFLFAYQNPTLSCQQMQLHKNTNITQCFIGTWKLISNVKKDGNVTTYPYGKNAIGYITYDANGYMSAQTMQQNRKMPLPGYFAYFGHYYIDRDTNVIHHRLEGSLTPAAIGTDKQRRYRFIGNQLHLIPIEDAKREIIWERIK